jgi:hypothetical protein
VKSTLVALAIVVPSVLASGPAPAQSAVAIDVACPSGQAACSQLAIVDTTQPLRPLPAAGLKVRYVRVEGRWADRVKLPLAPGDELTAEKVSQAMEALAAAINASSAKSYGFASKGEIAVLRIDVTYDQSEGAEPSTVGVIFHPLYLHFSLAKVGDSVIPIPRSNLPTFYENVPEPLLALRPAFGVISDRAFGTAITGSINTDVLKLPSVVAGTPPTDSARSLDLHAEGALSFDESLYRANVGIRFSDGTAYSLLRDWHARFDYDAVREPLGNGVHTDRSSLVGIGGTLKLAPTTRLSLDATYGWTRDTQSAEGATPAVDTTGHTEINRVMLDALPPPIYGFFRAALWQDNTWLSGNDDRYQRLVGRVGYVKDIPIRDNVAVGLEVIAGAGWLWGTAPNYATFFAGNAVGQFMYDAVSAPTLQLMPIGPILRSMGQGQGGVGTVAGAVLGGERFSHFNLTLALPIPAWSSPLIPNESLDIQKPDGTPFTLKDMIERQVDVSGPSLLSATLQRQGMTKPEADRESEAVLGEIRPAVHYVVRDANLYAVKPTLMFDAAHLSGNGGTSNWVAAGVGIQVIVVTAKLEVGYMRTLSGPTFGDRDNLFVRLIFQNLF